MGCTLSTPVGGWPRAHWCKMPSDGLSAEINPTTAQCGKNCPGAPQHNESWDKLERSVTALSCFWWNLKKLMSHLPRFYQSLLNAWQAVVVTRQKESYDVKMFAGEPLFLNPLFPNVPKSRFFPPKLYYKRYQKCLTSSWLIQSYLEICQGNRWDYRYQVNKSCRSSTCWNYTHIL